MTGLWDELRRLEAQQLYRHRRLVAPAATAADGVMLQVEGRSLLAFCSNDYLGLATDPRVMGAFADGIRQYGAGAGASHLVSGHGVAHEALEQALAALVGRPRALLFSSGYLANLGLMQALANRQTVVLEDRRNHASLLDASRLAGARVHRIPHANTGAFAVALERAGGRRCLLVTDGVFSMDGDVAPVAALQTLARTHDALLVVDDAHALGVLGDQGTGSFEHTGAVVDDCSVVMGTLGKAFGVCGAFVAGSEVVIETLIQRARTYIYTTALPPGVAVALLESVRIVRDEPNRRKTLRERVRQFRAGAAAAGLPLLASETPIQVLPCASPAAAMGLSQRLFERGIWVPAIRPPTVPRGTSRLRITFSANHTEIQVRQLLEALAAAYGTHS